MCATVRAIVGRHVASLVILLEQICEDLLLMHVIHNHLERFLRQTITVYGDLADPVQPTCSIFSP